MPKVGAQPEVRYKDVKSGLLSLLNYRKGSVNTYSLVDGQNNVNFTNDYNCYLFSFKT